MTMLPQNIAERPKEKFSRGAGSMDMLAAYADQEISDQKFHAERNPIDQLAIRSKEELLYYRIFRNMFTDKIKPVSVGMTRSVTQDEIQ